MKNIIQFLSRIMVRATILFFWLCVIAGFLFLPQLLNYIRPSREINVFSFPRLIDPSVLAAFEQESGIKVHINYYENNDELLLKMRQTQGAGYDLIIPSDYVVDMLRKEELLQPIDRDKIAVSSAIFPVLQNLYYDPENAYSLPYYWGVYGIGYDKKFFNDTTIAPTWNMIFGQDRYKNYVVGMINNGREAIMLAAFYLFGSIYDLDDIKLQQVESLLKQQKKWVQAYTDLAPDYLLLTGSSPVVAALNNEIWQAQKHADTIGFVVPQEGSFVVIDAVAIPKASTRTDLVYTFLNYLYKPTVVAHHVQKYSLLPVYTDRIVGRLQETAMISLFDTHRLFFFKNILSEKELAQRWFAVKAS